jgi:hypothetical protein
VQPGRDADHSPPSSVEVKYEQELYLLSPHAPSWHVAGHLYLYIKAYSVKYWQSDKVFNVHLLTVNYFAVMSLICSQRISVSDMRRYTW